MTAPAADVLLDGREHASLRCPVHDDRHASVRASVTPDGVVLLKCHAGCPTDEVVAGYGLTMADLFPRGPRRPRPPRPRLSDLPVPEDTSTPAPGTRAVEYLAHKRGWGPDVLHGLGCTAVHDRFGVARVRFPFIRAGRVVYWQDRRVTDGDPRWMGPAGTIPCPYQADRLAVARARGHAYLVEGVTDAVALLHAFPGAAVFGIPGAAGLKREWAPAFDGLTVWVLPDADAGGRRFWETARERLTGRALIHQVRVPPPWGDVDDWRRGVAGDFPGQVMAAVATAAERGTHG